MLSMKQTPMALLVETKLGEPLADFVSRLRNDDRSWPYIANKLRDRTDVAFSTQSLRDWFADADVAA